MADYCDSSCYAPGGHHGPSEGTPAANAYYDEQIARIDQQIKELENVKKRIQRKKTG